MELYYSTVVIIMSSSSIRLFIAQEKCVRVSLVHYTHIGKRYLYLLTAAGLLMELLLLLLLLLYCSCCCSYFAVVVDNNGLNFIPTWTEMNSVRFVGIDFERFLKSNFYTSHLTKF
jgi:hypothetical protein